MTTLDPGWLKRDVAKAKARVEEWHGHWRRTPFPSELTPEQLSEIARGYADQGDDYPVSPDFGNWESDNG